MQEEKGHCKHGVPLNESCHQCEADRMGEEGNTEASIAEEIKKASEVSEPARTEIALAKSPGANAEVMSCYTEALQLLDYAEKRVITTIKHAKTATNDLSIIANLKKTMEEKRKEYLVPLKTKADAIRETYNTLMNPVLMADKITRDKILLFTKNQEEINQKRIELAEAEMKAKGELSSSVVLVEETKRVSTDLGTSSLRDNWCFEVTDFALLPDEYKVADEVLLGQTARKHHDKKPVPGVRFYNEPILAVRTRAVK